MVFLVVCSVKMWGDLECVWFFKLLVFGVVLCEGGWVGGVGLVFMRSGLVVVFCVCLLFYGEGWVLVGDGWLWGWVIGFEVCWFFYLVW